MANKRTSKSATKSKEATSSSGRVTRITASDNAKRTKKSTSKSVAKSAKSTAKAKTSSTPRRSLGLRRNSTNKSEKVRVPADTMGEESTKNPLRALGRYFKGAWYELNQVRWPDRPTTWQMTGALLAFTAFFVLLIVVLDSLFKSLFEFILG